MDKEKLLADIAAVEEVLGWDCRGSDEEYKYMERASAAFKRLRDELLKNAGLKK